jgi:peptidoglycan/LPS O-acetylase OafA/YrhL
VVAVTSPTGGWAGGLWKSPTLRFLGKYSYGMYVFQNLLKAIFVPGIVIGSFAAGLGSIFLARCGYLIVMSLATIVAALLSWHLLEKRCLRLKSKFEPSTSTSPTLGDVDSPLTVGVRS